MANQKNYPTNKELTHLMKSIAAAYLLTGANQFRIIAYQKAADTIDHLTQELYDVWQNNHLADMEGLGPSIKQHLDEHFQDPSDSYLTNQLKKVPAPVYELMRPPGIGPKKAFKIVKEFQLTDPLTVFDDVKKLAAEHRIAELEGFGKKSEEDIVKAIGIYEERGNQEERMILPVATHLAEDIIAFMLEQPQVKKIESLGSLRRRAPTIGDIDLVVVCSSDDTEDVLQHFVDYPRSIKKQSQGEHEASIMVTGGKRIDVRVIPENQFGSMVQYFTGNKAHNIKLREYALKKGYSLNEFGIKKVSSGELLTFDTEEKFYEFLGLDWVPPEIREGTDEVKRAIAHKLPKLVTREDIKGEFHVHSSFEVVSSHDIGANTIQEMAEKAASLGYEYLALSEHNPATGKLSASEIAEIIKKKKAALSNVKTSVKLFNSLEIDIQPNGSLALPDEAFKHLDMAVASVHSSFKMSSEDMTKRILSALKHPKVKILGHPTGRQIGKREEIEADWQTIFNFAKKHGVALEINSWHERLDLPERLVKLAIQNGNKLVIDTDAHAAHQMDAITYGIDVARRGWAEKGDIINTQPCEQVTRWITGQS